MSTTVGAEGRDSRGRFTQGNPGGHGNPFARRLAHLRTTFLQTITDEDVADIAHQAIAQAKAGNMAAMKLVLSYAIGKPEATVDPDRMDIEEWRMFMQQATMMRETPQVLGTPDPELPLKMVRVTRPAVTKAMQARVIRKCAQKSKAEKRNEERTPSPEEPELRKGEAEVPGEASIQQGPPSRNGDNGHAERGTGPLSATTGSRDGEGERSQEGRQPLNGKGTVEMQKEKRAHGNGEGLATTKQGGEEGSPSLHGGNGRTERREVSWSATGEARSSKGEMAKAM